ncbi:MAG: ABC transporter permease [SAR324 cluster bacterium]|nr:ABC transporter permease [SAR324 cluster bacterium]
MLNLSNKNLEFLKAQIPLITLLSLVVIVGISEPAFFTRSTLLVVIADTTTLFLMSAGATFVILMGGIDLSVQAVASLISVIVAALLPEYGFFAILIAILAAALSGFSGGIAHHILKIPSFIATLAISGVVASAAFWLSDERQIYIAPELRDKYLSWATGETFGIQSEIVVSVVILAALLLIQLRTTFGRFVKAIGFGEQAVIASGIHVPRIKMLAFTLSGAMAGLSGVVFAARMSSGSPTLANEFLLPSIAAIIVGGTALTGGYGSIWRTFLGALIISVVRVGMTFVGISVYAQQIVFGMVLVVAVAITIDRSRITIVK